MFKKQGPALFELLNAEQKELAEQLRVPRWWREDAVPAVVGRKKSGTPEQRARRAAIVKTPPESTAAVKPAAQQSPNNGIVPLVELTDGRVRISLTSISAAVVVFVAMISIVISFEWGNRLGVHDGVNRGYEAGRASYEASTLSEIELAQSQPPATELVSSLMADAASGDGTEHPGSKTTWVQGYTYIVVQEFSAGMDEDASLVQAFLAQRDIETAKVVQPGGSIQVLTTTGFNHREPEQKRLSELLRDRVRGVGRQYYASGGGYKLEGYFRTLKKKSW